LRPNPKRIKVIQLKSKKPVRSTPRVRRRSASVDERSFTVVPDEDLHAKFDAFGNASWSVRDELRAEKPEMRTDIALVKTAVLELAKRVP
jgi:hypothetical protein